MHGAACRSSKVKELVIVVYKPKAFPVKGTTLKRRDLSGISRDQQNAMLYNKRFPGGSEETRWVWHLTGNTVGNKIN